MTNKPSKNSLFLLHLKSMSSESGKELNINISDRKIIIENKIKLFYILLICIMGVFLFQTKTFSQSEFDPDADVDLIATGIQQPEGPVWSDSLGLLFSDIKGNKIYRWTEENGKDVFLSPSDSTNGLTYDLEGRLIACQMELRRIVRFEKDGTQIDLADNYEGKKFNSPNDLVVKSDGSIFFTDPNFNIPLGQHQELSFCGIYRISPAGNLQLLDKTLSLPNGICFSPDEKKLYVNDSQVHKIYVWDVVDDSTITNKKLFFTIPVTGYADGMKVDDDGNIYCACASAIWVISPTGVQLGKIDLPSNVTASNCAWGDEDHQTLFITGGSSVYKVRPFVTSIGNRDSKLPLQFRLFQNYPNPFNPETVIDYSISKTTLVSIKVYDILGRYAAQLVNEIKHPGKYSVKFDGTSLPSGIYFYSITAGKFNKVRKMILLK
jgi:gluconolactonase